MTHRRLLTDVCPACDTEVGRSDDDGPLGSLVPNAGVAGLPYDACRYRPGPGAAACGYRLSQHHEDDLGSYAFALSDDVLHAQRRLDDLLRLDRSEPTRDQPTIAGAPVSLPSWVMSLQAVAVLVRAATGLPGVPEHPALIDLSGALHNPATTVGARRWLLQSNTAPMGSRQTAALTVLALRVLDAPEPERLYERLAEYRDPVREHRPETWKSWLHTHPDPHLRRLLKRHSRQGVLARAASSPASVGALSGSTLSQRVPPPHDRLHNPYRRLGVSDVGLHRVTSVLLYQRAEGTLRRTDALAALGHTNWQKVDQTLARLQARLDAAGLANAYRATLDALAAEPAVDWAGRSAALVDWTVPDDDWTALEAALRPLQKPHGRQPD